MDGMVKRELKETQLPLRTLLDQCYSVMDKEVINIKGLSYLHASPYEEIKKLEYANANF
ncbi:hypothetical protein JHK82_036229 [Glycine max]|nr:hypothetical protein JHK85_036961 [Glycine max]KAG4976944.1 hypothetical protein JHK86_036418 [Glycine max]KAG5112960.1 hypothetical protein JHK82_036229 [Glycine max]KAG5130239.1 hypothetical protein JHK84_036636 [Glycine max]KHN48288.1 hypothetical protein glysoja_007957 [Glycine soja]